MLHSNFTKIGIELPIVSTVVPKKNFKKENEYFHPQDFEASFILPGTSNQKEWHNM